MGGKSALNYQKYHNTIKGYNGFNNSPRFNAAILDASPKQISYVKALLKQLKLEGIDPPFDLSEGLPTSMVAVTNLIKEVNILRRAHGVTTKPRVEFINMCKEKSTGKRIKYRTTHRYCAPVGYEFMYEITYEHIIPAPKAS